MNAIEEKIILGKITALEVGLQSGNVPYELLCKEAEKLLQIPTLSAALKERLCNLLTALADEEEQEPTG